MNERTITNERGVLTCLLKLLVKTYKKRRGCQSLRKKNMRWKEPSDTSSSVENMTSLINGSKIQRQFPDTRSSLNTLQKR